MSRIFLQLVIIAFLFVSGTFSTQQQLSLFRNQVQMHVISDIPNDQPLPLLLQCQSKDTYLGRHSLKKGEELAWHFGNNIFISNTLFFCHFYWGSKSQVFDVFNQKFLHECLPATSRDYSCYWLVKPDGFYRSNNNTNWKKKYDWA